MFKLKRYGGVTNWVHIKFVLLNYGINRRSIVTTEEYESKTLFIKVEKILDLVRASVLISCIWKLKCHKMCKTTFLSCGYIRKGKVMDLI